MRVRSLDLCFYETRIQRSKIGKYAKAPGIGLAAPERRGRKPHLRARDRRRMFTWGWQAVRIRGGFGQSPRVNPTADGYELPRRARKVSRVCMRSTRPTMRWFGSDGSSSSRSCVSFGCDEGRPRTTAGVWRRCERAKRTTSRRLGRGVGFCSVSDSRRRARGQVGDTRAVRHRRCTVRHRKLRGRTRPVRPGPSSSSPGRAARRRVRRRVVARAEGGATPRRDPR